MALSINVEINQKGAEVLPKTKKQIQEIDTAAKNTSNGFSNLEKAIGAVAVVAGAGKFIQAFEESERNMRRLQTAAINAGDAYKFNADRVNELTKALQNKTNYGDDEQVAALAKLTTMTGDYEKALAMLPNILDLAAYSQQDLQSATEQYGKAAQGNLRLLGSQFSSLKDLKESGASTAEVMDRLNKMIAKQAEMDVSKLKQFENLVGDAGEKIGEFLLPSLNALLVVFTKMPSGIQAVTVALPFLGAAFAAFGGPITLAVTALAGLALGIGKLVDEYDKAMDRLKPINEQALATQKESLTNWIDTEKKLLEVARKEFKAGLLKDTSDLSGEERDAYSDRIQEMRVAISEKEAKIAEYEKRLAEVNKKMTPGADVAKLPTVGKKDDNKDNKISFLAPWLGKEVEVAVENINAFNAAKNAMWQSEVEGREGFRSQHVEWVNAQLEVIRIEEEEIARKEELIRLDKLRAAESVQTIGTMLGSFAQLNQAMKGNAKITQALLIGETIMNTSAAIMKIMAQGGIFATPLAIATGIQGAAQVANIASQKFADGGWVKGNGNSRSDNIPVMLSPKERVLSVKEVNRMGGQQAVDRAVYAGNRGGLTLNIQGSLIAHKDWIREELIPALEREAMR